MLRVFAFVLVVLTACQCWAETAGPAPTLNAKERLKYSLLVDAYTRCAGAYDLMAEAESKVGDVASATSFRDMGNGAEVTSGALAFYLLGAPISEAADRAAHQRKSQATYFLAMINEGNRDGYLAELKKCKDDYVDLQGAVSAATDAWFNGGVNDLAILRELMQQALRGHLAGALAAVER